MNRTKTGIDNIVWYYKKDREKNKRLYHFNNLSYPLLKVFSLLLYSDVNSLTRVQI